MKLWTCFSALVSSSFVPQFVAPLSLWYESLHIGIGATWEVSAPEIPTYLQVLSWEKMVRIHVSPNTLFSLAQSILSQKNKKWLFPCFPVLWGFAYILLFSFLRHYFSCFLQGSNGTLALWELDSYCVRWKQISNIWFNCWKGFAWLGGNWLPLCEPANYKISWVDLTPIETPSGSFVLCWLHPWRAIRGSQWSIKPAIPFINHVHVLFHFFGISAMKELAYQLLPR